MILNESGVREDDHGFGHHTDVLVRNEWHIFFILHTLVEQTKVIRTHSNREEHHFR